MDNIDILESMDYLEISYDHYIRDMHIKINSGFWNFLEIYIVANGTLLKLHILHPDLQFASKRVWIISLLPFHFSWNIFRWNDIMNVSPNYSAFILKDSLVEAFFSELCVALLNSFNWKFCRMRKLLR